MTQSIGETIASKEVARLKAKMATFDRALVLAKQMCGRINTGLKEMHSLTHELTGKPSVKLDEEHTKELVQALVSTEQLTATLLEAFEEVL